MRNGSDDEPSSLCWDATAGIPALITYKFRSNTLNPLALQVFNEMLQRGLEPNVITFTAVICADELTLRSSMGTAAGTPAQCNHLQCGDQCMQKVRGASEGLAAVR